jgi:starch-binding outer membrane protein, SusD/RagB family
MRRNRCTALLSPVALAGLIGLAGCDLDVQDLNNPPVDGLENDPSAPEVASAAVGLQIGSRAGTSAPNGYISQLGILGRESYNFDPADPRYFSEMLEGTLNPASPFGGAFWGQQYQNLRLGDIIQRAKENVPDFDDAQKAAISGFVKTIRALDLLRILSTRDEIGGVIDTDHPPTELGAVVSKDELMAEIASVLDSAVADLENGGDAFPFDLSSGYTGLDTPATFLQFNRALRARLATYQEDYETVLEVLPESFLVELDATSGIAELEIGAYHTFGTGVGDVQNGLINVNIFAHPSTIVDAEEGDLRVRADENGGRKVQVLPEGTGGAGRGVSSDIQQLLYTEPNDSVPIIRNEELILFRAEASLFTGDLEQATADLNIIRQVSAQLPPLPDGLGEFELLNALIYERRYSLFFEGHRLIDLRRFDARLAELDPDSADETGIESLPLDMPTGDEPATHVRNIRWPLPSAECDARPEEARCAMGSQP